jgi:hypothetical protein
MLRSFAAVHEVAVAPQTLINAPPVIQTAPSNFSSFNPALLAPPRADASNSHDVGSSASDEPLLVFFRVSNMHFCPASGRASWRDSIRLETHVRSFLAVAELYTVDRTLRGPGTILGSANALFRTDGEVCEHRINAGGDVRGTFSGPEDPRPFWGLDKPRAPWLLASVWSDDCRRLRMHLIKLPTQPTVDGSRAPQQLPLFVDRWIAAAHLAHPESEPLQKNWLPFVHRGALLVEYSIEPHVVLLVDTRSGRCVPATAGVDGDAVEASAPFPSFAPLLRLQSEYGRVSGGAAPLHLTRHRVYLGLAHTKATRQTPQHIGTVHMAYRHVFYAFEDRPPFAIVAMGEPMALPEPSRNTVDGNEGPTVQFAAGMVLSDAGDDLIISFSSLDCGARLTTIPLDTVLQELSLLW